MSDNTTLPGTGESVRTIDKTGKKTQVVTLDLGGSGAETLVSGSIPVTGTFWQATQPVSGSVSVSNFPATQPVSGTVAISGTVPVSGTFWQTTQPVSFTWAGLTDTQLRATPVPVSGTVTANTGLTQPLTDTQLRATAVPVSGTFWQATQPVSIAATVNTSATVSNFPATQAISAASLPLPSGASTETTLSALNTKVTACNTGAVTISAVPTLTKATQGTTGFSVQDLKDSGRSARTITLDSFAVAATAETLMTMSYSTDNGTLTTGTSYSVTTGKRLRITAIMASLHTIAGNTTAVGVIVRLRVNNAGAALVSSPVQAVLPVQGVAAANQGGFPTFMDIPDGWEFVAGAGIGVTVACPGFVATTAAPKVDITIIGYEY